MIFFDKTYANKLYLVWILYEDSDCYVSEDSDCYEKILKEFIKFHLFSKQFLLSLQVTAFTL